jgi:hypothetical protein
LHPYHVFILKAFLIYQLESQLSLVKELDLDLPIECSLLLAEEQMFKLLAFSFALLIDLGLLHPFPNFHFVAGLQLCC